MISDERSRVEETWLEAGGKLQDFQPKQENPDLGRMIASVPLFTSQRAAVD
jgi:hypothetical protein